MESKSKSDTSRQNGAKSRGPVTPEGKARSSQNARKHGLCATFQALPNEDQAVFDALLASFEDSYRPATPLECELVRTLAILRWRLRRIPDLETAILINELALAEEQIAEKFSEIDDPGRLGFVFHKLAGSGITLPLLLRYETSLNRVYDRTLKQLLSLQKLQPPAPIPGSHEGDPQRLRNEPSPTSQPPTGADPSITAGVQDSETGDESVPSHATGLQSANQQLPLIDHFRRQVVV